ncbi:MAG: O-antigen ligase family protein [Vicinamibacterales bacterium]
MRRLLADERQMSGAGSGVAAAAARTVAVCALACFTAVVCVLFQAAFWIDNVTIPVRVLLGAVAILACVRPSMGLLAAAVITPLAQVGGPMLGSSVRHAEVLILAVLAGALVRAWISGAILRFPSSRLETAALVFGFVVSASCVEQLWFAQMQRDFPRQYMTGLWNYVSSGYLVGLGSYGSSIMAAMLLLEGMALLLIGARLCREAPGYAARLIKAVAIGAVVAAAFNVQDLFVELGESGRSLSEFFGFIGRGRWAANVRDINAAGSFFGMALFLVAGRALAGTSRRGLWMAATVLVAAALIVTDSRTALVVVFVIALGTLTVVLMPKASWLSRAVVMTAVTLPVVVALVVLRSEARGNLDVAWNVRWMFLGTTARMLGWQPLSGVGVGQYALWSQHFSSPELLEIYRIENAHNNFAQVAGEMGWPGLAAFVAVLGLALARWRRAQLEGRVLWTDLLALAAFMTTWMGNHPLLVPAVAYPFWIALAAAPDTAASSAPAPVAAPVRWTAGMSSPVLVLASVVLLAVSLPPRVDRKSSAVDWSRVSFGFHEWEPDGADRVRWMSERGRFYVSAEARRFEVPMQALVSAEDPITVDVLVDGRPVDRVKFDSWDGHTLEVPLWMLGEPVGGAWEIDFVASRSWVPAEESPESRDRRRLSIRMWETRVFGAGDARIDVRPEGEVLQPDRPRRRSRGGEPRLPRSRREAGGSTGSGRE